MFYCWLGSFQTNVWESTLVSNPTELSTKAGGTDQYKKQSSNIISSQNIDYSVVLSIILEKRGGSGGRE